MNRLKIIPVTSTVYCVQRVDYLSCSYFVVRPEGVILIDSGIDPNAEDMREGLKVAGLDFPDVRSILITHWHNDHSSGAAAIQEVGGAEVACHAAGSARLARRETAKGVRGWLARRMTTQGFLGSLRGLLELAPARGVEATSLLQEGDQVAKVFRVLETPGHEAGHLSFLYEPEGILFTGDALAVAHDRLSFMSRFLTADKQAARQSMLRCIDSNPEIYCPGHRGPLIKPPKEQLDRLRERLNTMRWWPIIGCGET
jgi:glyoxylase-like metal-dependent hydrolase (beta-lactamase superfamily II)